MRLLRDTLFGALIVCAIATVQAQTPTTKPATSPGDAALQLTLRSRKPVVSDAKLVEVVERDAAWDPARTALIICDMWDVHWCASATRRTGEIAPRIDALARGLRDRGGLIIHAPSDTMAFYADAPQRRRAVDAPKVPPPSPPNRTGGPALPIDDSDNGCDDEPMCVIPNGQSIPYPWKRQIEAIGIGEADAITDNGQEVYNLLKARGIEHLLVAGVHANMCILHRSFAIKQMTRWGVDVALVRDLTDAMYNPRKAPFVAHDRGTALVVEHVETHWCPSVNSADVLGDAPKPRVVIVTGEHEYRSKQTLPAFAKAELEPLGIRWTHLNSDDPKDMPGLDALDDADALVLYTRRRTLPEAQLQKFKAWFDAGKPVVALRTSSHSFQNYLEFDRAVLGGTYGNHYGNKGTTRVRMVDEATAASHPLLRGVSPTTFDTVGSLYKNNPLGAGTVPLLMGKWGDKPEEPVAWTNAHRGGRVFYTSLGHAQDFESPPFRALLRNAVLWALDKPVPAEMKNAE